MSNIVVDSPDWTTRARQLEAAIPLEKKEALHNTFELLRMSPRPEALQECFLTVPGFNIEKDLEGYYSLTFLDQLDYVAEQAVNLRQASTG